MKNIVRLFLVLALTSGCANLYVGNRLDESKVATIVPGRSNKDFVRTTFGTPLHVVNGPDGDIWVYRHLNGNQAQELCISFNGDVVSVFSHE